MKMNERAAEILERLQGLGTEDGALYTNAEIIEKCEELQEAMAKAVFEKTHAENMRSRDLLLHFDALAKEYNLRDTDLYRSFSAHARELGYTIGTYKKGMKGEKIARRALKLLSFDQGVKILYNVELEDEDAQAEYDAIAITPYGLFVVEVKNWDDDMKINEKGLLTRMDGSVTYDIPGRMGVKEALLREILKEHFPKQYYSLLVFPQENVKVEDHYHKIPITFGGSATYEIRAFSKQGKTLDEQDINKIAELILSAHKVQRGACPVNCKQLKEDFANLMSKIEESAFNAPEEKELKKKSRFRIACERFFFDRELEEDEHLNAPALFCSAIILGIFLGVLILKTAML